MAQLKVEIQTWTNGKTLQGEHRQYRLGEDKAEAVLTSREGTTVTVHLFSDGSGRMALERDGQAITRFWPAGDLPIELTLPSPVAVNAGD